MSEDLVPEEDYVIPLGKAEVLQEGKDMTLLGYGASIRQLKMVRTTIVKNDRQLRWPKKKESHATSLI